MASPIEKVVIIFLENHTLDNLASEVSGVSGDLSLSLAPDVVTPDPPHGHQYWMARKTGWPGTGRRRPYGGWRAERYGRAQLPTIYQLMDAYTVCDNYFSDFAGNSFPNHAFAIGADAEWAHTNPGRSYNPILQTPGVPVRVAGAGKSWARYGSGFAFKQYADPRMHARARGSFLADARAGRLPNVSWVYAPTGQDFHPGPTTRGGCSMARSDAWLKSAVQAVANGPDWNRVVLFITFDDWGGWADHVDPPVAETFPNGGMYGGEPYRFGSRVPCIVVGPYAKVQHVSHVQSSHASLVAFIERLWGLPPSPNPDAARRTTSPTERALQDCVDVNQPPLPPPAVP
jgi:phospholipase C